MAVDVEELTPSEHPEVLRCAAGDIRRGDQVAFVSADDEHVAGPVTGKRVDGHRSTVALVVDNRVHFVAESHSVVVIRFRAETTRRLEASGRAW